MQYHKIETEQGPYRRRWKPLINFRQGYIVAIITTVQSPLLWLPHHDSGVHSSTKCSSQSKELI